MSQVGQVVLLPSWFFADRYDAGSAARPLYYSNRIESNCFPFGPYVNVFDKRFGCLNFDWRCCRFC